MFTEFILNFDNLNDYLPFRSSFDYQFNFAWDQYGKKCHEKEEKDRYRNN